MIGDVLCHAKPFSFNHVPYCLVNSLELPDKTVEERDKTGYVVIPKAMAG